MSNLNYWYHAQIRQYLKQIIRVFGNFQIRTGVGRTGTVSAIRVPVRYADMSRLVAHTLRGNTENAVQSAPFMTVHITAITMAPERRQMPTHVSSVNFVERRFDEATGEYTDEPGDRYTVDRYMPVPYNLNVELHLWTTSTEHKLQLLEQILTLFNPSLDIQTSTNPVDWTSITMIEMQDSITWSDRSVPQGVDDTVLDVARLAFLIPIWLSPPARVHRQKIIHQIMVSLMETDEDEAYEPNDVTYDWLGEGNIGQMVITPGNHRVRVRGNDITLLHHGGGDLDDHGQPLDWNDLLVSYGYTDRKISQLRLKSTPDLNDWSEDIIGTIEYDETTPNVLHFTVDAATLPSFTLPPLSAVIDPHQTMPGNGLPAAREGHRYLLIDEVSDSIAWGDLVANANDIIEFDGSSWQISFDALERKQEEIVQNLYDNSRLKWTGGEWIDLVDGDYFPGYWRILI